VKVYAAVVPLILGIILSIVMKPVKAPFSCLVKIMDYELGRHLQMPNCRSQIASPRRLFKLQTVAWRQCRCLARVVR